MLHAVRKAYVREGELNRMRVWRERSPPRSSGSRWKAPHAVISRYWGDVRRCIDCGRSSNIGRMVMTNRCRDCSSPSHSGSSQRLSHHSMSNLLRQERPRMLSGNCSRSWHLEIFQFMKPSEVMQHLPTR